jgi:hypothetical protein
VVEDARLDTATIDQDFALAISGSLARPGVGLILLDRTNYTAPGVIEMTVLDTGRAGNHSLNVQVKSTTEPAGESVALSERPLRMANWRSTMPTASKWIMWMGQGFNGWPMLSRN